MDNDLPAVETSSSRHQCDICKKTFSRREHLMRHTKNIHKLPPKLRNSIHCPHQGCSFSCNYFCNLHDHLEAEHAFKVEKHDLNFYSMKDFDSWKDEMQKRTKSSFTTKAGQRKKSGVYKRYYSCHRSGNYKPLSNRVRAMKRQGSCRTGHVCPAFIEAEIRDNDIKVLYCSSHYGHDHELSVKHLSKNEKLCIAEKLSEGFTLDQILDDIKKKTEEDIDTEHLHLLTKRHLNNIKRDFSITNTRNFYFNESLSISMWVENMNLNADCSPVLCFKDNVTENEHDLHLLHASPDLILCLMTPFQEQMFLKFGNDSMRIDTSHSSNQNFKLKLTTVMISDEYDNVLPVAFCICERIDAESMTFFFTSIKAKVGVINPYILMSNDIPTLVRSWEDVMGPPKNTLMCFSDVHRNWKEQLSKVPKLKREPMYRRLQELLEEVNRDEFTVLLERRCTEFNADPDVISFGKYFSLNYASTPSAWAECYRTGLSVHSDLFEDSQEILLRCRYMYIKRKKMIYLDKAIYYLLDLVREKIFKRVIQIGNGEPCEKVIDLIALNHHHGIQISPSEIITLQPDIENECVIKSDDEQMYEQMYNVRLVTDQVCNQEHCKLRCADCEICIHTYSCTCLDYLVQGNMCYHIHAVCSFKLQKLLPNHNDPPLHFVSNEMNSDPKNASDRLNSDVQHVSNTPNVDLQTVLDNCSVYLNIGNVRTCQGSEQFDFLAELFRLKYDSLQDEKKNELHQTFDRAISILSSEVSECSSNASSVRAVPEQLLKKPKIQSNVGSINMPKSRKPILESMKPTRRKAAQIVQLRLADVCTNLDHTYR